MAINPSLVSIKKVEDIPTVPISELATGQMFGYTGGGDLKKVATSDLLDFVKSDIKGVATQSNAPTPYDAVTYPNGLFERYLVHAPLTSPNNWENIIVTAEDLDVVNGVANNEVVLEVNNGVATKRVRRLKGDKGDIGPMPDVKPIIDENIYIPTGNLFDKNNLTSGFYIGLDGAEVANTSFSMSDFLRVEPNKKYNQDGLQTTIFYDENKNVISGTDSSVKQFTTAPSVRFVRLSVNNGNLNDSFFTEGDLAIDPSTPVQVKKIENILTPIVKRIVHNDTSYNSIRVLAEKCYQQANYWNRYEIYVLEGLYTETDWKGFGSFVTIKGQNRDNCIIYFDGNSDKVLPSDYSFPSESGKVANVVSQPSKHIVYALRNCEFENLTFFAENCKYPLHLDNPSYQKANFKNCIIKDKNCNYPIGSGTWAGQEINIIDCVIEREAHWHIRHKGILIHNTFNQLLGSQFNIKNCFFKHCSYLIVFENGSNCKDIVNLENCTTDGLAVIEYGVSQDGDGKTTWTNHITGIKESDPKNVPYNIVVNAPGTKIEWIEDSPNFTGYTSSRPLFARYIHSDYTAKAFVPATSGIQKGDLVCQVGDSALTEVLRITKFESFTNNLPPVGIALENEVVGGFINIVPMGKIAKVKSEGGVSNYNANTRKLIYNETSKKFISTPSASYKNVDAIAHNNDLDENGYILAMVTM